MKIAHISDLHFGRISDEHLLESLIQSILNDQCDLVLVTGDLTQRARKSEFTQVNQFFQNLSLPHLIIPGNHDIHAWWHRPDLRVFNPLKRYKKMISHHLEPYILADNIAILGLNTAHGLTIKNGRCTASHKARIREFFSNRSPKTLKILATHHPLEISLLSSNRDVARGGHNLLVTAATYGVHVICAGHWHVAHVSNDTIAGNEMLFSYAGTACSDRWRAPHIGLNSWNSIERTKRGVIIRIHGYNPKTHIFEQMNLHSSIYELKTIHD